MAYDNSKIVELYELKAQNFSEDSAPNQKKYYQEAANWLRENVFDTYEEVIAAMRNTKYYEGAGLAKTADDIELRIRATREAGYEDVAQIHQERKEKFAKRGNEYAFSQEWIDDYNRASEASARYAGRKEIFGRIFNGYFQIKSNPQGDGRKEGAKEISKGLEKLQQQGLTFDELAAQPAYVKLTMLTGEGMKHFVDFIHDFVSGSEVFRDDLEGVAEEQQEIEQFIRNHKSEIIAAGQDETWKQANCVAVPSDDPLGYDFTAMKIL